MKIKTTTHTKMFFEKGDYIAFQIFLINKHLTQDKFAERMNITPSYLTLIIHGDRPATEKMMRRFKNAGFDLNQWRK